MDESNTIASLAPGTSPDTAAVGSRLTFFRQWLRNPLRMSSITPSGRQLADMMATAVPDDGHGVIELGAGTGAITRALIERGIDPQHLLVVEMNAVLHDMLQRMFPRTHVVQGDARQLTRLVAEAGTFGEKPVDAIVSSLGLLAMPQAVQHDILAAAFSVMPADGVFIQYTYGPSLPVAQEVCTALGLRCRKQGWAWRNLPPARVFVYSRQ